MPDHATPPAITAIPAGFTRTGFVAGVTTGMPVESVPVSTPDHPVAIPGGSGDSPRRLWAIDTAHIDRVGPVGLAKPVEPVAPR